MSKKRIISYIVIIDAIVILVSLVPIDAYNQLNLNLEDSLKEPNVFVALMVVSGSIMVGVSTDVKYPEINFNNFDQFFDSLPEYIALLKAQKGI